MIDILPIDKKGTLPDPEEFLNIRIGKDIVPTDQLILALSLLSAVIIFVIGILNKLYLDYFVFAILIIVVFVIAAFPYLAYLTFINTFFKKIEDKYPLFLSDLAEALSSGLDIISALKTLSKKDYGYLNPFIKKLYVWLSWGIPFDKTLKKFNKYFEKNSPLIAKINNILLEAYLQGGELEKVLKTVYKDLENIKEIQKDINSKVMQQVLTLYIIYFIFIGLIAMLKNVLEPLVMTQLSMKTIASQSQANLMGFGQGKVLSLKHFKTISALAILMESLILPFVIGIAESGKIKSGLKHLMVTLFVAIVVILFFIIPPSVKITLKVYPITPYVTQKVSFSGSVSIDGEPAKGYVTFYINNLSKNLTLEGGLFKYFYYFDKPGNYTIRVVYTYNLKKYEIEKNIQVYGS